MEILANEQIEAIYFNFLLAWEVMFVCRIEQEKKNQLYDKFFRIKGTVLWMNKLWQITSIFFWRGK